MKEIRLSNIQIETRSDQDQELVLVGTPIVFEEPTTIHDPFVGDYTEVISRNALDGVDLNDTRLLYNHDTNKVPLARAPKTMTLTVTDKGVEMRAVLANTEEARSVYTAVERGTLDGMSFGFKVPDGGDDYDRKTNTRTIRRIEKVYEVSVVAFPAYPTTSVEARNALTSLHSDKRNEVLIKCNKILFKKGKVIND